MKLNKPRCLLKAFLIWLCTNAIGAIIYLGICLVQFLACSDCGNEFSYAFIVIILGFLFSVPVIPLLIPILWLLTINFSANAKVIYAFAIILILCSAIISLFFLTYGLPFQHIPPVLISFFLPYIIAAEISFFVVAWKMIFNAPESTEHISTSNIL